MRIICLTSNGYINCIEPFAYYWNKFAGEDRRVTVACYDVQPEGLPDNFDVLSIGKQADYTWSSGLLKLLERIDDELILLMLEDYFLSTTVDWHVANSLESLMTADSDVVKCDLTDDRLKVAYRPMGYFHAAQWVIGDPNNKFQTSLQAALWRTDFLRRFLNPNENAWEFEKAGTKRVIDAHYHHGFKGIIVGTFNPPMHYANAVGGAGGKPGVIEAKHMPSWMADECREKGWMNG